MLFAISDAAMVEALGIIVTVVLAAIGAYVGSIRGNASTDKKITEVVGTLDTKIERATGALDTKVTLVATQVTALHSWLSKVADGETPSIAEHQTTIASHEKRLDDHDRRLGGLERLTATLSGAHKRQHGEDVIQ